MKISVVTDQPWDVPADVLVVPVMGAGSGASGGDDDEEQSKGRMSRSRSIARRSSPRRRSSMS
jgi:hypothetical protein